MKPPSLAALFLLGVPGNLVNAISIQGIPGLAGSLFSTFDSLGETTITTDERITPVWACDIRAWTRAPDLYPGAKVPAEARLAVNGSACGDIVGWEAGLRYKERAIIKMK
jgi:hypothetical protein